MRAIPLQTRPENGFTPAVDVCRTLIGPKTKAIVLVKPNNPTGATYSPALIAAFATLAREKYIALIVDETSRAFILTGSAVATSYALLIIDRSSSVVQNLHIPFLISRIILSSGTRRDRCVSKASGFHEINS